MANKHIQRKWNEHFEAELDKGRTLEQTKKDLIEQGVSKEYAELKLRKYKRHKKTNRLMHLGIVALLVAFIVITPFIFQKPTITGAPVGLGGDIYYVDATNGNDGNDGLSPEKAFMTLNKALSVISDGDSLYIMDGIYSKTTGFTFQNKVLYKGILITAYPGSKPIITSRIPEFYNASSNIWKSLGEGLWVADYSADINAEYWAGSYKDSNVSLFTYSSLSKLNNSDNPEGIFFDNGNNKLYLRLDRINDNPNNIALSISSANVLTLSNIKGSKLRISNLTFECGYKCMYVTGSSNLTIDNNNIVGGLKGVDVRLSGNITINNNVVFMIQGDDWSWKDDTKGSLMETSAIWLENDFDGVNVSENEVYGHFNGIMVYSTSLGKFKNIRVHNNFIYNIMDDGLEIEDYCNGGEFYNNFISDSFVAISLAPVDASEKSCLIHHNILVANKSVKWDHAGTFYTGECYKVVRENAIYNLTFSQNSCIGRGVYASTIVHSQRNVSWKDNIFYSNLINDGRLIERSGLSSDGVFYDYNLYYRTNNLGIFRYWNSDSVSTEYKSLDGAKASSNWDGKWDVNSVQADPLFVDFANSDFRPQSGSPACNMSSTGSYVGALPCVGESEPEPFCGDGSCNGEEDCDDCSDDCGACVPDNNVPTHSVPVLNASDNPLNGTDATLRCYNISTSDADGDSVTNSYRWFRNGSLRSGLTSGSVDKSYTSVGDSWKCEVRPYDGKGYGVARNSSSLVIRAICNNSVCESGESCSSCQADCGICTLSACTLEDSIWDEDTGLTNAYNLSACFTDPLGQSLNFSVSGNSTIRVDIGRYGLVNLSAPADWKGFEYVTFSAVAGNRSAQSNTVSLIVRSAPDCGDAICERDETCRSCPGDCGSCPSSGGGGGGSRPSVNTEVNESANESGLSFNESSNVSVNESVNLNQSLEEPSNNASLESPSLLPSNDSPYVGPSNAYSGGKIKDKNVTKTKSSGKEVLIGEDENDSYLKPTKESPSVITITSNFAVSKASFYMTLISVLIVLAAVIIFSTGRVVVSQRVQAPTKLFTPYIISCLDNGYSYDAIRTSLRSKDLSEEYIDRCFKELKSKGYATRIRVKEPVLLHLPTPVRKKLLDDLSNYVSKKASEGFTLRDIRLALLSYGHSKDIIDEIFEGREKKLAPPVQNFVPFITACLNSGYSYDAIRTALKSKNISKADIDGYFEDLQAKGYAPKVRVKAPVYMRLNKEQKTKMFNTLSVYVTKQVHEGFELEDIRSVLVNYGHSKDIVDDVIESKK